MTAERSKISASGGEAVDWGWAEVDDGRNKPLTRFRVACGGAILPPRRLDRPAIWEMSVYIVGICQGIEEQQQ